MTTIGVLFINKYNIFESKGKGAVITTWILSIAILVCYVDFGSTANKENAIYGDSTKKDIITCMTIISLTCVLISIAITCV